MRKIVLGYLQEEGIKLGIDLKDLQIIRYIYDFIKLGFVVSREIDGEKFYWIKSSHLLKELPILEIKNCEVLRRRLKNLVELKILDYRLVKKGGLFTFYRFGENYKLLLAREEEINEFNFRFNNYKEAYDKSKKDNYKAIHNNSKYLIEINDNSTKDNYEEDDFDNSSKINYYKSHYHHNFNNYDDMDFSDEFNFNTSSKKFCPKITVLKEERDKSFKSDALNSKVETKDNQVYINKEKDNKKIYTKKVCEEVIDFLNNELGTKYKSNTKQTVKLIERLIDLGFDILDFKKVILNKKRCWKDTEYEIYLRPSTLFRESKFEEYLNEKYKKKDFKEKERKLKDVYKPFFDD